MRLDIGKSSRSLEIRSRDSAAPFRLVEEWFSPGEASVLGLAVLIP
jgi:hypothetical protein